MEIAGAKGAETVPTEGAGGAPSEAQIREILVSARTIAVVGLSPNPARPSHGVARYLQEAGYRIVPVRPGVTTVLGEPAYPDLRAAHAAVPIDIVDVFRRSEYVAGLLDDLLRIRPRLVWLQVGIQDDVVAERLAQEGIPTVMDHCLKVDHHFLLGR